MGQLQGNTRLIVPPPTLNRFRATLLTDRGTIFVARVTLPEGVPTVNLGIEVRTCAKSEVRSIDTPPKPKVNVQESIANAKVYCKQHPESFVSLRDYSGGIYNETCAAFAAEQQATDPLYKIGSD
jgi:hypothetical protein